MGVFLKMMKTVRIKDSIILVSNLNFCFLVDIFSNIVLQIGVDDGEGHFGSVVRVRRHHVHIHSKLIDIVTLVIVFESIA